MELRKVMIDDLEMLLQWRMDPEVTRFMYTDPKLTIEDQKEWFTSIQKDETSRYWIIRFDGIDIGLINITKIDTVHKRCLWAYYIADMSMRGKGIGKDLECNIYDYVFQNLGLEKLCCEVFSFNEKVVQIHERFGSRREGYYRNHIWKNGISYDVVAMAILKGEWEIIRKGTNYNKISIA